LAIAIAAITVALYRGCDGDYRDYVGGYHSTKRGEVQVQHGIPSADQLQSGRIVSNM
jgi:hypothetical protein